MDRVDFGDHWVQLFDSVQVFEFLSERFSVPTLTDIYKEVMNFPISIPSQHIGMFHCSDGVALKLIEAHKSRRNMKKNTKQAAAMLWEIVLEQFAEFGGTVNDLQNMTYGDYVVQYLMPTAKTSITITQQMKKKNPTYEKIYNEQFFTSACDRDLMKTKYQDLFRLGEMGLIRGVEITFGQVPDLAGTVHDEITIDEYLAKTKLHKIRKHWFTEDKFSQTPNTVFKFLRLFEFVDRAPKLMKEDLFDRMSIGEFHSLDCENFVRYSFVDVPPEVNMLTKRGQIMHVTKKEITMTTGEKFDRDLVKCNIIPYFPVRCEIAVVEVSFTVEIMYNIHRQAKRCLVLE